MRGSVDLGPIVKFKTTMRFVFVLRELKAIVSKVAHQYLLPVRNLNFSFHPNLVLYCFKLLAQKPQFEDPCNPNPCGQNAICNNGQCSCPPEYSNGDGYQGCRPECLTNNDCSRDKACVRAKCVNPCERELCGRNAICEVYNHFASCTCPSSMQGNAFIECRPYEDSMYC